VGAGRTRDLFDHARTRARAPAIVFIDETDALGPRRDLGSDERGATLNQLLAEMDGFQQSDGVVALAATNRAARTSGQTPTSVRSLPATPRFSLRIWST